MICFKNVSLSLADCRILSGISLTLEAKRTHILLGPSGSGKSTFLKMILGLHPPDRGQILLDGTPLTKGNRREKAQRIGYCIQHGGLFPHLTAEENILLVARMRKKDRKISRKRLSELADLVHIEEKTLQLYPRDLSGGEKQRTALIRALHGNPDILLMDEPLAALDPIRRHSLKKELHCLFQKLKKTVIFVTHDIFEASYLSDNVILMAKGRIIQTGPFKELLHRPVNDFVSDFFKARHEEI